MKKVLVAASAMLAVATTGAAQTQLPRTMLDASGASAAALQSLFEDWDQIGFQPPSKPAQYRVYGRDGYVTSGPGYNATVALMRTAAADSRAGREHEALAKIAAVRRRLAQQRAGNRSEAAALTPR